MKAFIKGFALAGLIASGCGTTRSEPTAPPTALQHALAAHDRGATAPASGIPGCAATLSVNVRQIIATPSLGLQAATMWSQAKRALSREDVGPEALADLARLGIRSPSDIHSVELCMTAAPGRRPFRDSDRAGLLVRGPFTQGLFNKLVMKWAESNVDGLWQHNGINVVRLDDGMLFAQRPDGNLVIAKHAAALTALLDAPLTPLHARQAVALRIPDAPVLLRDASSHDTFPAQAIQSFDLAIASTLDSVELTVLARNELAASDVLAWLQQLTREATREVGDSDDTATVDYAFASALADATVTRRERTVTFVATLPAGLPDLALKELAQEL